jgi:hypothetical protein
VQSAFDQLRKTQQRWLGWVPQEAPLAQIAGDSDTEQDAWMDEETGGRDK